VLLDLPLWIKSGSDILSFVASTPAFQREGITSQQLAQAEANAGFTFLLNGWNEIADTVSEDARLKAH